MHVFPCYLDFSQIQISKSSIKLITKNKTIQSLRRVDHRKKIRTLNVFLVILSAGKASTVVEAGSWWPDGDSVDSVLRGRFCSLIHVLTCLAAWLIKDIEEECDHFMENRLLGTIKTRF